MSGTARDAFNAGGGDAPRIVEVVANVDVEFADLAADANGVLEFAALRADPMREVGLGRVQEIAVGDDADLVDAEGSKPAPEIAMACGRNGQRTTDASLSIVKKEAPVFCGPWRQLLLGIVEELDAVSFVGHDMAPRLGAQYTRG